MSTLFLVHAHPDDEAIFTGGVMLAARDAGHRVVLVTCTRGEEGEIHNMDEAVVRPRLAEVRTAELEAAVALLGVDRLEFLGYRDSGMEGTDSNWDPRSFHMAALAEAAGRLAEQLRQERPEVVVTYGADGIYWHPDHVKAHHATVAALDLLAGEGLQPAKFYEIAIPREALEDIGRRLEAAGRPNAFGGESRLHGVPQAEITTVVDCRDRVEAKKRAFEAHVSQMAPDSFFLNTPDDLFREAFGRECFVLARGRRPQRLPETELFAGIS